MKFYDLTPEGKIIAALLDGDRSFTELLKQSGLSNRWLTLKLRELVIMGVVQLSNRKYHLDHSKLQEVLSKDLGNTARLVALELAECRDVVAVVLFGSVAKGSGKGESDIDLLVITEKEVDLSDTLFRLMVQFDVQIETVTVTFREFLNAARIKPPLFFGLLEGYKVLFDRGGINSILRSVESEITEEWFYDGELEVWVRRELMPIWKTRKST